MKYNPKYSDWTMVHHHHRHTLRPLRAQKWPQRLTPCLLSQTRITFTTQSCRNIGCKSSKKALGCFTVDVDNLYNTEFMHFLLRLGCCEP